MAKLSLSFAAQQLGNTDENLNLAEKLKKFTTHWDPHVIADYNDNDVMVVRFIGEYPFHKYDTTDDFFYVLEGELEMDIEGEPPRTVRAGELLSSPNGLCIALEPRMKSKCSL